MTKAERDALRALIERGEYGYMGRTATPEELLALLDAADERDNLQIDYYTLGMTCPVCAKYGDGCNCGGVVGIRAAAEQAREALRLSFELAMDLDDEWRAFRASRDTALASLNAALDNKPEVKPL